MFRKLRDIVLQIAVKIFVVFLYMCMIISFYTTHIDHIKHNGDPSLEKKRNSVFYLSLNLKQKTVLPNQTEIFCMLKYPVVVCTNFRSLNIVIITNVLLLLLFKITYFDQRWSSSGYEKQTICGTPVQFHYFCV